MTVFKKLQTARYELSQANVKKSGHNTYGNWKYYQLDDFIPAINKIFDKVGLCGVVTFGEMAMLTIYDTDDGSSIQFFSPIVYAENNKGQPIQVLGSTHTYLRRYLWLLALELVEFDLIDSLPQQDKPKPIAVEVKPVVKEVPKESDGDLEPLAEVLITFGDTCEDLKELTSFWKQNQSGIDRMKVRKPELFKSVQEAVAQYKSKFKG
jgi:hypothetical protein